MRLLKLLAYGLLGYALYEFFRGMTQAEQGGAMAGGGQGGGSRELNRAMDTDTGRMNMTGPAEGTEVQTQDPSGASVRHKVGRGVVS
jgi:hypothetical protein